MQNMHLFSAAMILVPSLPASFSLLAIFCNTTHSPAAFYHTFPPDEARRLVAKLEIHHTPLHGSWLNMAEIEFAALARHCLSRRIGTVEELESQVACWQEQRNSAATTINWRFTTADARIKLKRLYPSLKNKSINLEPETVAKEV
jgi:hypothetical protein